jgi:hypothetical protein
MERPKPQERLPNCPGARHPVASVTLARELTSILDWYMENYRCQDLDCCYVGHPDCESCVKDRDYRQRVEKLALEIGANHEEPET